MHTEGNGKQRDPKLKQQTTKMHPKWILNAKREAKSKSKGSQMEPSGAKREPKGAKWTQKGPKREPKGAKRKLKGSQRDPKLFKRFQQIRKFD